jgi:dihydrodipicolinate synthase/N-acetylneuraminate lyase
MNFTTSTHRRELQSKLFPQGIPRLWCPTLTHFCAAREPDAGRIRAHLTVLAPHVRGILVPGSTGEGWEMSDEDIRGLLSIVLDSAAALGVRVLIGILKTSTEEVLRCMDALGAFQTHAAFAGYTVCPAKGSGLEQASIRDGLARVLSRGQPTALYQLPQVTQNEMSAETVESLADEFPNFILFKDTSGADRVAQSGADLGGVFLVRGAEAGGYAPWPRVAGGPYDGFLLSTANVFAPQFDEMLRLLDAGDSAAAVCPRSRFAPWQCVRQCQQSARPLHGAWRSGGGRGATAALQRRQAAGGVHRKGGDPASCKRLVARGRLS